MTTWYKVAMVAIPSGCRINTSACALASVATRVTVAAVLGAAPALAQGPHTDQSAAVRKLQAARFPQPVLVGTLATWRVFLPGGRYHFVGPVVGVFTPEDDDPQLAFRDHGRLVALPLDQVALVGAMVKALDMDEDDIAKLPAFKPAKGMWLPATATVKIGLDKKY